MSGIIDAAVGRSSFTLLLRNARVLNVFTGEIIPNSAIGIYKDTIVYVGPDTDDLEASETLNLRNAIAVPGLVDSHLHIESTMMIPSRFAEAVLPRGTTTVFADPHEIANVLGKEGVRMMLENAARAPMKIYFFAPTCVPESSAVTSGAEITTDDVVEMLSWEGICGLGEMMDFGGVLSCDPKPISILEIGRRRNVTIDGHAVLLSGRQLAAYVASGPEADHENFDVLRTIEKARQGMKIKLRGPDILDTREFVRKLGKIPSLHSLIAVTDDVMPDRLASNGHLDNVVRSFMRAGLDPLEAVRSATLYPSEHMKMKSIGSIAPGRDGDIIVLEGSLRDFHPSLVFSEGRLVARSGKLVLSSGDHEFSRTAFNTIHVVKLSMNDFEMDFPKNKRNLKLNVIDFQEFSRRRRSTAGSFLEMVLTRMKTVEVETNVHGEIDLGTNDLALVAVFERHGKSGRKAIGFVRNLIGSGALATTVAHDAHNLVVLGREKSDMLKAAQIVIESGGGIAAVRDSIVLARIDLPIAGLMSSESLSAMAKKMRELRRAFAKMQVIDHPYMPILCLLTLSVIPHIRITDKGLYDVDRATFRQIIA